MQQNQQNYEGDVNQLRIVQTVSSNSTSEYTCMHVGPLDCKSSNVVVNMLLHLNSTVAELEIFGQYCGSFGFSPFMKYW